MIHFPNPTQESNGQSIGRKYLLLVDTAASTRNPQYGFFIGSFERARQPEGTGRERENVGKPYATAESVAIQLSEALGQLHAGYPLALCECTEAYTLHALRNDQPGKAGAETECVAFNTLQPLAEPNAAQFFATLKDTIGKLLHPTRNTDFRERLAVCESLTTNLANSLRNINTVQILVQKVGGKGV